MEAGPKEWMGPEWHRQADESLSHCSRLNEHTSRPTFLFLRDFSALFSAANIIVLNNVIVFNVPSVLFWYSDVLLSGGNLQYCFLEMCLDIDLEMLMFYKSIRKKRWRLVNNNSIDAI